VPIILVGNHSESLPELRQISPEEGRELSQKFDCAWIEVSAKYNENVGEAFELLLSEVEKFQASHAPASPHCSVM
jgi:Ras family protein